MCIWANNPFGCPIFEQEKNMAIGVDIDQGKIMSRVYGSPSGIRAVFVPIDDKWAIKLFDDRKDRDRAYFNQQQAAEYELGPDVGEKIEFSVDCEYPHGYITEIVEVLVPHQEIVNKVWDSCDYYDQSEEHWQEVDKLQRELKFCTGIDYGDMHPANIGIKNGHYVLIDFGQEDIY